MSLFHEQISNDLQRLFAATGRRCYLIGSLDGGFPNLGHHLPAKWAGLGYPRSSLPTDSGSVCRPRTQTATRKRKREETG